VERRCPQVQPITGATTGLRQRAGYLRINHFAVGGSHQQPLHRHHLAGRQHGGVLVGEVRRHANDGAVLEGGPVEIAGGTIQRGHDFPAHRGLLGTRCSKAGRRRRRSEPGSRRALVNHALARGRVGNCGRNDQWHSSRAIATYRNRVAGVHCRRQLHRKMRRDMHVRVVIEQEAVKIAARRQGQALQDAADLGQLLNVLPHEVWGRGRRRRRLRERRCTQERCAPESQQCRFVQHGCSPLSEPDAGSVGSKSNAHAMSKTAILQVFPAPNSTASVRLNDMPCLLW
jgi:hypothetical protein